MVVRGGGHMGNPHMMPQFSNRPLVVLVIVVEGLGGGRLMYILHQKVRLNLRTSHPNHIARINRGNRHLSSNNNHSICRMIHRVVDRHLRNRGVGVEATLHPNNTICHNMEEVRHHSSTVMCL